LIAVWTKDFWLDAGERALKTFAQVFLTFIVVGTTGVMDLDWVTAASVAAVAALASVLTSIVSEKVGDPDTASLIDRR
jgi:hypothetical protein